MEPVSTSEAERILEAARTAVDAALARWALLAAPAVRYSLLGPGKRLRGAVTIEAFSATGGRGGGIADVAAAVEIMHAYSLVHDDLPCMDDAELRRGRPTTHRAFGTAAATRAGFAMIPLAARALSHGAEALHLDAGALGSIARELFAAGGAGGMIGGQYLDLLAEGQQLDDAALEALHRAKTGALFAAACAVGAVAAGASDRAVAACRQYGQELGLAFQIADDLLDATSTTTAIGKPAGRDAEQAKATFVTALGVAGAAAEADQCARRAVDALRAAGVSSGALSALAEFVTQRRS